MLTRQRPLYLQVKESLQREIERSYKPGDMLPSEPELEKRYGVSRITIRRALDELVSERLIIRQQGRGTFVREPQVVQDLARAASWTASMLEQGLQPQTISCEYSVVEPAAELRDLMKLNEGQNVLRIQRVRYASGDPMCIMLNYLPDHILPDLPQEGLINDSLLSTLQAHNFYTVRCVDKVEARAATQWEAKQLHIAQWSPLLQVTRVSYQYGGHPLHVDVVISRADRWSYIVQFGEG